MSAHGFASHARKLVQTSQQFFSWEAKMRIVGDLAQAAGQSFMNVTPELIAGYFAPMPIDGTLPADRMAQANLWKEILVGATRLPIPVQQGYDFSKIFAWMASLGGLKNINQMRVQVLPDEQLTAMAQRGNVIPMQQGGGGTPPGLGSPSAATTAGLNAMVPQTPPGSSYGG
jgi:hypothetical protein